MPTRFFKEFLKAISLTFAIALGAGIGLAFLRELVFDQTVRRPQELEVRFGLPVFLTIPDVEPERDTAFRLKPFFSRNGKKRDDAPTETALNGNGTKHHEELRPFFGALRDRVIMSLERMTHRPKLVALAGSKGNSGVTSLATGLATALAAGPSPAG